MTVPSKPIGLNDQADQPVAINKIWRVFFAILSVIFVVEAGVMFVLPLILPENISPYLEAIADAGLLSIGAAPLLWLTLIRPLQKVGLEKIAIIAAVTESASEGHIIFSGDGSVISSNKSAERIFGISDIGLQGKCVFDLLPKDTVLLCQADAREREIASKHIEKQSKVLMHSFEYIITRTDGQSLAVQMSLSVTHIRKSPIYLAVVQDIEERKQHEREMEQLQQQLVETSRRAGMSEIATGVLHNVGNVLNSINVSVSLLREMLESGHAGGLQNAVEMLVEHQEDLTGFFLKDQKKQQLLDYLSSLSQTLQKEKLDSLEEINTLVDSVDHVKEVVHMQQSFARVAGLKERFSLGKAIDDAIRINDAGLVRHGVEIVCSYDEDAEVLAERHKVLQIMINLISNAKYAVSATDALDKRVSISIEEHNDHLGVIVKDNGVGISSDNLTKIFHHGFTTKQDGHGFGLHSSILAAKEMGGLLSVESDGLGCGATFTLTLPSTALIQEGELCLA